MVSGLLLAGSIAGGPKECRTSIVVGAGCVSGFFSTSGLDLELFGMPLLTLGAKLQAVASAAELLERVCCAACGASPTSEKKHAPEIPNHVTDVFY